MKELKLNSNSYWTNKCHMELGRCYIVETQWWNTSKCAFIKTSKKGFNLLNIETNKCYISRPIYQPHSGKRSIYPGQRLFEISMPKWIIKITETDDYLSTENIITPEEKQA